MTAHLIRPQPDYLFVYGSLLSGIPDSARPFEARQPFAELSAGAELLGPASAPGQLFAIAWYPGYVPGKSRREQVRGEVWRLTYPDRVFGVLDYYEGHGYVRSRVRVRMDTDAKLEAFTYLLIDELGAAPRIESGDYLTWLNPSR